MNSQQVQAFQQAVGGPNGGYTPADFAVPIVLIVGAVAVLWLADMVRRLGMEALMKKGSAFGALAYKVRALILIALLLYLIK